jgi:hypothetical protein
VVARGLRAAQKLNPKMGCIGAEDPSRAFLAVPLDGEDSVLAVDARRAARRVGAKARDQLTA